MHRGVAGVLVSKITNQRPQFSRLLEHVVQKLLQSNLRLGHGNGYLGQVGPKKTEDPKKSEDIKLLFIIFYYHVIFLTLEAVFPPPWPSWPPAAVTPVESPQVKLHRQPPSHSSLPAS